MILCIVVSETSADSVVTMPGGAPCISVGVIRKMLSARHARHAADMVATLRGKWGKGEMGNWNESQ